MRECGVAGQRRLSSVAASSTCVPCHHPRHRRRALWRTGGAARQGDTLPAPGPGEVRLRQTAIGVNFIDVYCRTGFFDLLTPPGVPGMEAAGVDRCGRAGRRPAPGDRVAYACPPVGAYAERRAMAAELLVRLPDDIYDETAAAGLLKGVSASSCCTTCIRCGQGRSSSSTRRPAASARCSTMGARAWCDRDRDGLERRQGAHRRAARRTPCDRLLPRGFRRRRDAYDQRTRRGRDLRRGRRGHVRAARSMRWRCAAISSASARRRARSAAGTSAASPRNR